MAKSKIQIKPSSDFSQIKLRPKPKKAAIEVQSYAQSDSIAKLETEEQNDTLNQNQETSITHSDQLLSEVSLNTVRSEMEVVKDILVMANTEVQSNMAANIPIYQRWFKYNEEDAITYEHGIVLLDVEVKKSFFADGKQYNNGNRLAIVVIDFDSSYMKIADKVTQLVIDFVIK